MKSSYVLSVVLFLLFVPGYADDISVSILAPSEIKYDQKLNITIIVGNNLNRTVTVNLCSALDGNPAILVEPQLRNNFCPTGGEMNVPYFVEWNLTVAPYSSESVHYVVRPPIGRYVVSYTYAILDDGRRFGVNSFGIGIVCNANSVCEPEIREDYVNCPTDCNETATEVVTDILYSFTVKYDGRRMTYSNLELVEGTASARQREPAEGFSVKLISNDSRLLYLYRFGLSGERIVECGGNDPSPCGIINYPYAVDVLTVPYFKNAKAIEIYDSNNKKLLTIDVSKFAPNSSFTSISDIAVLFVILIVAGFLYLRHKVKKK